MSKEGKRGRDQGHVTPVFVLNANISVRAKATDFAGSAQRPPRLGGKKLSKDGATENARHENSAQGKMQGWKMQEWNIRHKTAGLENVILENVAQKCRT